MGARATVPRSAVRRRWGVAWLAAAAGSLAAAGLVAAAALGAWPPEQRFASLGDVRLEGGGVLEDCRIGYRLFGTLDAARSNAVVVTTWSMGTSGELARQIGPGKAIDSGRYFVVAVDALGNGVSSSPSNSARQPGAAFPTITVRDMVTTQHRLVTQVLALPRLKAVFGVSLGGMQAFEWATRHPSFVERVVSVAGSPRTSEEDRRRWQGWIEEVEGRSRWKRAAGELGRLAPLGAVRALRMDPYDYRRQSEAIMSHDITAPFGGSLERAAAAVRARMMVVVSERDEVVDPAAALELGQLTGAEVLRLDGRCGHGAPGCNKATLWPAVARFLER